MEQLKNHTRNNIFKILLFVGGFERTKHSNTHIDLSKCHLWQYQCLFFFTYLHLLLRFNQVITTFVVPCYDLQLAFKSLSYDFSCFFFLLKLKKKYICFLIIQEKYYFDSYTNFNRDVYIKYTVNIIFKSIYIFVVFSQNFLYDVFVEATSFVENILY